MINIDESDKIFLRLEQANVTLCNILIESKYGNIFLGKDNAEVLNCLDSIEKDLKELRQCLS